MALLRRVREGMTIDPEIVAGHPAQAEAGRALRAAKLAAMPAALIGSVNALFWTFMAIGGAVVGSESTDGILMFALALPFAGLSLGVAVVASDIQNCVRTSRHKVSGKLLWAAGLGAPFIVLAGVVLALAALAGAFRVFYFEAVVAILASGALFTGSGIATFTCGWVWLRYRRTLRAIGAEWQGLDPMRD